MCYNDSPVVHLLEVDLDCLYKLHDQHNYHPLAGEKIKVTEDILPEYHLLIIEHNDFSLYKSKEIKRLPPDSDSLMSKIQNTTIMQIP